MKRKATARPGNSSSTGGVNLNVVKGGNYISVKSPEAFTLWVQPADPARLALHKRTPAQKEKRRSRKEEEKEDGEGNTKKGGRKKRKGDEEDGEEDERSDDDDNDPDTWPLAISSKIVVDPSSRSSSSHSKPSHISSATAWALRPDTQYSIWTTPPTPPTSFTTAATPTTTMPTTPSTVPNAESQQPPGKVAEVVVVTTEAKRMMVKLPFFVDSQEHFSHPDFNPGCIVGQRGKDIMVTVIPFGAITFGHLEELGYSKMAKTLGQQTDQLRSGMVEQYKGSILQTINTLFWNGLFTLPQSSNPQVVIIPNSMERFCIDLTMQREAKGGAAGASVLKADVRGTSSAISAEENRKTQRPAQREGREGSSGKCQWRTESRRKELDQRRKRERDTPTTTTGAGIRWDRNKQMRKSLPNLKLTLNSQFGMTLKAITKYHIKKSKEGKETEDGDGNDGGGTWLVPELLDAFVALHEQQKERGLSQEASVRCQEPILMVWELWADAEEGNDSSSGDDDDDDVVSPKPPPPTLLSKVDALSKRMQSGKNKPTDAEYKAVGNDLVAAGCYSLAAEAYSQGISLLHSSSANSSSGGSKAKEAKADGGDTAATPSALSVLYSNRCACHLHTSKAGLGKGRSRCSAALRLGLADADAAILDSPTWFKAHLRKGDALKSQYLERIENKKPPTSTILLRLLQDAIKSYEACVRLADECPAAQESLGWCMAKLAELEKAHHDGGAATTTAATDPPPIKRRRRLVAATAGFAIGSAYHDYTMATFDRRSKRKVDELVGDVDDDDVRGANSCPCSRTTAPPARTSYGHTLTKLVGDTLTKCGFKLWYWGMQLGYMSDYVGPTRYGGANIERSAFYLSWNQLRAQVPTADPQEFVKAGHALVAWGGEAK